MSIGDPIGRLQRELLKIGGFGYTRIENSNDFVKPRVFGYYIGKIFNPAYIFVIGFTPEHIKNYGIEWEALISKGLQNESILRNNLEEIGKGEMARLAKLLEGLRLQTIRSKWITIEIDRITGVIYFIIIILIFFVASIYYPHFLDVFVKAFNNVETTRTWIQIFAFVTLIMMSFMIAFRILELQKKASLVFRYLATLGRPNIMNAVFEPTLSNIERYLDSGDWTLAEYWLDRTEIDYLTFYLNEVKPK